MDTGYRFHIRGHLDDRWSEWLGDLSIERRADGSSVLSGPIADQAALHGVIGRIRDLGLPLLAVECVGDECAEISRSDQPGGRGSPCPAGDRHDPLQSIHHTESPTPTIEGDHSCD
jgi:hypothetical protein